MLPFVTFGSNQYIKKKLIELKNDSIFLTSALTTRFIIAIFVFTTVTFVDVVLIGRESVIISLVFYSCLILRSFDVIELYFDSNLLSKKSARVKSVANILTSAMYFFALSKDLSIFFFSLIFLSEYLMTSIFYCKKLNSLKIFNISGIYFNSNLIKNSFTYFCAEIFTTIQNRFSFFFIEYFLGISTVSFISVSFRVADLSLIIPSAISISFLNVFYNSTDEEKSIVDILKILNVLWIIAFTIFAFFGKYILHIFYGENFVQTYSAILIILFSNLFVFWGFILEIHEIKKNHLNFRIIRTIIGMLVNLILCYFLIPRFSIIGAAISYLISTIFNFHISQYLFKETRPNAINQIASLLVWKSNIKV